jgi:hypothetical protein
MEKVTLDYDIMHLIIWNTFNNKGESHGTNPVPYVASRTVGPHQMANWLNLHGYTVKVIDFCHLMETDELVSITEKFISTDTVSIGCSSTFWKNYEEKMFEEPNWVISARSIIEKKHTKIEWILGGTEAYAGKLYRFKWRKFYGYSEELVLKYLDEKANKNVSRTSFDIKTLEYNYGDGAGIVPQEVLPIQLSRGCQFKCSFCRQPLLGKKKGTYLRNYNLIERELLNYYYKYGTTRYYFIDDTVNESEEKVIALADIASKLPFKLEWVGYNRLDLISSRPHTIELLKASGLKGAFFGIESFTPASASSVGKGWNGKHAKDFLLKLKSEWKGDVTWVLSFIVGLSEETAEHLDITQKWLIENEMYSWLWNPLYISSNSAIQDKSQFERNSLKHGYSFPTDNEHFWKNNNWDFYTAERKAIELSKEKFSYDRVSTWRMAEYATATGYSFDSLMTKYTKDIDENFIKAQTIKQVKNYVNFQLNYDY